VEHVRPGDEARRLARRYADAVGPEYQAATRPETAVRDILVLEAMRADGRNVALATAGTGFSVVLATLRHTLARRRLKGSNPDRA
jgi:hypothetical protein